MIEQFEVAIYYLTSYDFRVERICIVKLRLSWLPDDFFVLVCSCFCFYVWVIDQV